jgi:phosphoglycolate phosphatase
MTLIKAVIVDIDDTLCLTEAVCFGLENEVLERMRCKPMSRDVHVSTWGRPLFEAMPERSPGVNIERFKALYSVVLSEYNRLGKYDTIPQQNYQALDELIRQGKTIMLLTSRTHGELSHLMNSDHLLVTRIKAFYYRDNMQFHKPDPRAFDEVLRDNDLQPNQCVYIGDSTSDAVAAKKAGLHFIASLESGLREKRDFNDLSVDYFISGFPELISAIAFIEAN